MLACFALKEEAAPFRKLAEGLSQVEILVTGMGRRRAEGAVREFLRNRKPPFVVSSGFAGGLDPQLVSGTVVFAAQQSPWLDARLLGAGARKVRFHCAERVAVTAAEKHSLRAATGADAVEMESQAIGAVCAEAQIPFATVRVILDTAEEDLPLDFNRLMTPDLRMDYGKLAMALLKSPGRTGALLKLQKQGQLAAASLARVLMTLLDR